MVTLGGKKQKLAKGKENRNFAEHKFHELMHLAAKAPASPAARVVDVVEAFLRRRYPGEAVMRRPCSSGRQERTAREVSERAANDPPQEESARRSIFSGQWRRRG